MVTLGKSILEMLMSQLKTVIISLIFQNTENDDSSSSNSSNNNSSS